jgi:hypothetical protein
MRTLLTARGLPAALLLIGASLAAAPAAPPHLPAAPHLPVSLKFAAVVGSAPLQCGTSYPDIGLGKSAIRFVDFRFYVSDVQLISARGDEVPLTLTDDRLWQHENVALLDFENGTADCANGTPEIRTVVEGTAPDGAYTGVHAISGDPEDMGRFKAPTLRNIALTAPYMHDGSIATLEGVLDHYAAGGRTITSGPNKGVGADNPRKSPFVKGIDFTLEERRDLIAFLRSLTDDAFVTDPRHANPWDKPAR